MSSATITESSVPLPSTSYVTTDGSSIIGSGNAGDPIVAVGVKGSATGPNAINAGTGLAPGMPFYVDDDGLAQPALAGGTSQQGTVQGVVLALVDVDATAVEYVLVAGFISLVTSVWDARTGGSGGLVTGTTYYTGTTAGSLTDAPTAGAAKIGTATSPTTLSVAVGSPASPASAQAEHFTIAAGVTQAISQSVVTTFFAAGSGSGTAHATLGPTEVSDPQPADGFQKTFHAANTGECEVDLTPALFLDGTKITFSGDTRGGGCATLAWDGVLAGWWIVSLYEGTLS